MPSLSSLRDFWRSLESRSQITLVVSLLAVVATMYGIYHFASQPSYTTIETGLSPSSTGRVTDALSSAGISYKLTDGGTSIAVQDGQQDEARIALGKAGVTPGGHTDFSIFDKSSLSDTDFQQQVNYQRALEGTIASTIESIDGVDAAQVQVVVPKDQLFQDEQSQATASVMVTASMGLDSSTVRGVAHMVASSVQGLDPNNVTITDQTGALLWPGSDGGGGGAPSKLQAQQAYGAQLSSQIDAMLTRTLGPGKAEARVAVDLNVDETTKDSITYGDKPVPLNQSKSTETLNNGGASPNGPAGTPSNLPPGYTGGTANNGQSTYKNTKDDVQNGVDYTKQHTVVAPGAINKMDVALLVDKSVSADGPGRRQDRGRGHGRARPQPRRHPERRQHGLRQAAGGQLRRGRPARRPVLDGQAGAGGRGRADLPVPRAQEPASPRGRPGGPRAQVASRDPAEHADRGARPQPLHRQ